MQARMELKLSQKDVAQKINEKPSVLQDYESGRATPNPQILGKLERVLGVKLRGTSAPTHMTRLCTESCISAGTAIGTKLGGPKKA